MLPLSHDEVVHLKRPLLGKMPGADDDARFANLRALYAWMWAHPGKQLLFMGSELAETREWSHDRSLDWGLLDDARHAGVRAPRSATSTPSRRTTRRCTRATATPAGSRGSRWRTPQHSVLAFERCDPGGDDVVVCVANLQDVDRRRLPDRAAPPGPLARAAVHRRRALRRARAAGCRTSTPSPCRGRATAHSAVLTLPPLTVVYLVPGS